VQALLRAGEEARWLRERVATGDLRQDRLRLAAYLDHEAAQEALGDLPEISTGGDLASWFIALPRSSLDEWQPTVRAVLSASELIELPPTDTLSPYLLRELRGLCAGTASDLSRLPEYEGPPGEGDWTAKWVIGIGRNVGYLAHHNMHADVLASLRLFARGLLECGLTASQVQAKVAEDLVPWALSEARGAN